MVKALWLDNFCLQNGARQGLAPVPSARPLLTIHFYTCGGEEEERYLIDKIYCGTPVSIAEQIYLLCGQQPPHRFLASILVPLFLKYWLTPGLENMIGSYGKNMLRKVVLTLRKNLIALIRILVDSTSCMNGVVNLYSYARSGLDVPKRQFVGPVTSIRLIPNPSEQFFHHERRYIKTGSPTFPGVLHLRTSVPASKNPVEGAIPGELWTRQGSVAAATLIGSIAQTNTCRITRPTLPVHIHTSGGSTVVPRNRRRRRRRRRRKRERKKEKKREVRQRIAIKPLASAFMNYYDTTSHDIAISHDLSCISIFVPIPDKSVGINNHKCKLRPDQWSNKSYGEANAEREQQTKFDKHYIKDLFTAFEKVDCNLRWHDCSKARDFAAVIRSSGDNLKIEEIKEFIVGCLYCNGGVVTVRCTNNAGNANSRNHAERCGANSISVQGFGILAGWLAANNRNQLGPVSSTNTPR
ncbi:hypothetical protein EAG_05034 [Camponotus floridanus]|uniref:Uncharacterized protein n=1 Tax=Camponotus floridanus TaxID=104421 RepID=E2AK18_CAMFO|nr:hypothetical protein EAG_05034 [Camponotus floridanus]